MPLPGGTLGLCIQGPVQTSTVGPCYRSTLVEAPLLQLCLNEELMIGFERKSYLVENVLPNLSKARRVLEDVGSPEEGRITAG